MSKNFTLRIFMLFMASLFLNSSFALSSNFPLDFVPDSKSFDHFSRTYGFVISQNMALSRIQKQFPELYTQCIKARSEFDLEFGASFTNLVKLLKMLFADKWSNFDASLRTEIQEVVSKSVFTKQYALEFLKEVSSRAKGQIESPVIETLLMLNPSFIENPVEELNRGFTHIYRTKGHPKAKGIDIQIEYPMSWSIREGKRLNIIKFIRANNGKGPASLSIMVKDILAAPGIGEFKNEVSPFTTINGANKLASELFSHDSLVQIAKGMGAKNVRDIKSKRVVIDRWPGAMVEFKGEGQRVDLLITFYYRIYICLYRNYMLSLHCGVWKWPWDKGDEFQKRIGRYIPIFRKTAYSFIIQSQY